MKIKLIAEMLQLTAEYRLGDFKLLIGNDEITIIPKNDTFNSFVCVQIAEAVNMSSHCRYDLKSKKVVLVIY